MHRGLLPALKHRYPERHTGRRPGRTHDGVVIARRSNVRCVWTTRSILRIGRSAAGPLRFFRFCSAGRSPLASLSHGAGGILSQSAVVYFSGLALNGQSRMSAVRSLSGGKRTPREYAKIDVNDPKVSFGNGYTSVSWQGVRYLLDHNVVRHQIVKVDERRDSAGFHYGPINRRARK